MSSSDSHFVGIHFVIYSLMAWRLVGIDLADIASVAWSSALTRRACDWCYQIEICA